MARSLLHEGAHAALATRCCWPQDVLTLERKIVTTQVSRVPRDAVQQGAQMLDAGRRDCEDDLVQACAPGPNTGRRPGGALSPWRLAVSRLAAEKSFQGCSCQARRAWQGGCLGWWTATPSRLRYPYGVLLP